MITRAAHTMGTDVMSSSALCSIIVFQPSALRQPQSRNHCCMTYKSSSRKASHDEPSGQMYLVCQLFNEDERADEDVGIVHILLECCVIAGVSELL